MRIIMNENDSIRVSADSGQTLFCDLMLCGYKSLALDLNPLFAYIEIREKDKQLRVFMLPKKSMKKEIDYGWWEDAEVVYSCNNQIMNK